MRRKETVQFPARITQDRFRTRFRSRSAYGGKQKQLSDIFGVSVRTIQNWQDQGMPVVRGGGKGNEVLYDSATAIKWFAERDADIENEKLRKEVEELRKAGESDLQPGTIDYERYRLTRSQADAQELKNAKSSAEVVETAFCTFVLSRVAGEIASILDGIPCRCSGGFLSWRIDTLISLKGHHQSHEQGSCAG
jgi:phage terminase Nu1 subunit (DNA packaging protein)